MSGLDDNLPPSWSGVRPWLPDFCRLPTLFGVMVAVEVAVLTAGVSVYPDGAGCLTGCSPPPFRAVARDAVGRCLVPVSSGSIANAAAQRGPRLAIPLSARSRRPVVFSRLSLDAGLDRAREDARAFLLSAAPRAASERRCCVFYGIEQAHAVPRACACRKCAHAGPDQAHFLFNSRLDRNPVRTIRSRRNGARDLAELPRPLGAGQANHAGRDALPNLSRDRASCFLAPAVEWDLSADLPRESDAAPDLSRWSRMRDPGIARPTGRHHPIVARVTARIAGRLRNPNLRRSRRATRAPPRAGQPRPACATFGPFAI